MTYARVDYVSNESAKIDPSKCTAKPDEIDKANPKDIAAGSKLKVTKTKQSFDKTTGFLKAYYKYKNTSNKELQGSVWFKLYDKSGKLVGLEEQFFVSIKPGESDTFDIFVGDYNIKSSDGSYHVVQPGKIVIEKAICTAESYY